MRKGKVISSDGGTATVVFDEIGLQRTVPVARGVEARPGDTAIVLFSTDSYDCVLIGVVD